MSNAAVPIDETERISDLVGGGMPPALHVVQLIIVITDNYNSEEKEEDSRLPLTLGENYSALAAMT